MAFALLDRLLNIQRAHDAVFGCAHRQINDTGLARGDGQHLAVGNALTAFVAVLFGAAWVAAKAAVRHHFDLRQQRGQCAGSGRFRRTAFPTNEHAADAWVDGVQDERPLHAFLADYCSKWVNRSSWHRIPIILTRIPNDSADYTPLVRNCAERIFEESASKENGVPEPGTPCG